MADKFYYNEHNTKDYRTRRRTRKVTKTYSNGEDTISVTKIRQSRFKLDLCGGCFIISLCLLLGSFFFNGYFDGAITETRVDTTITNNIGGESYDYNLVYVDYDYEKKLNQLGNLKNVFDTSPIQEVATASLLVPTDAPIEYPLLNAQLHDGNIFINSVTFTDNSTGDEVTVEYYDWNFLGGVMINLFPEQLGNDIALFINKNNYLDYINLNYVSDLDLSLVDKVLGYFNRFFIFMNAPLIWLYNFIYDVGVFISILTIW